MTRDDIIRMAREAGLCIDGEVAFSPNHNGADVDINDLQAFANLVAAAEREWQGLTDQEILDAWLTHSDTSEATDGFARAIETKLKEKNT
jgi:hypothetical protein